MERLIDKSYRQYDYISRYLSYPYFYHTTDNKYIYSVTSLLRKDVPYTSYVSKIHDTFDSIALDFYNNPTLYWVVCDFNDIQDPYLKLKPGTTLKIPLLSSISVVEG